MFKAFKASSPQVEVYGRTILAVVDGILIGAVRRELFESCGLDAIQPDGWYSQELCLKVYRCIQENLGSDSLNSIGRRIPYNANFPSDQMHDVPTALASIDVAYRNVHRGGDIGHYKYVEIGPDHFEIQCDNPYPNELDLGIITSLVERFRGRTQYKVSIKSPPTDPHDDNSCVFEIFSV